MAATDEAECIEEVTRLLALMFHGLERVAFAMLMGSEKFTGKRVNVKRKGGGNSTNNSTSFDL